VGKAAAVKKPTSRWFVAGIGALTFIVVGCGSRQNDCPSNETPARAKVRISWSVESSQNLYGFIIYRGPSPEGPWTRVNPKPILAAEGGTTNIPYDYHYVDDDTSLVVGRSYWYWLEGVDSDAAKHSIKWPPERVVAKVRIDQDFPPPRNDERWRMNEKQ
jgi:hypothetical protein